MRWLLWKDFRLARPLFLVTALLVIVPHAVYIFVALWGHCRWSWLLDEAGLVSLQLAQFPLLILGGQGLAGERADRSAEFLACQPVSRSRILLSKFVVVVGLLALTWIPNLILMAISGPLLGRVTPLLAAYALIGATFFGVAWLFSSWIASPVFATCAGFFVPCLVMTGFAVNLGRIDPTWKYFLPGWIVLWLTLAVGSLLGGTLHYLRRVEP